MTKQTAIRRRPDGSIDAGYYTTRGRRLRSEAAHAMAKPRAAEAKHDVTPRRWPRLAD